jgi:hypothetical protein
MARVIQLNDYQQMKGGVMRNVIPTYRDEHKFTIQDIIGFEGAKDDLPAFFKLVEEGYKLSNRASQFNMNVVLDIAKSVEALQSEQVALFERFQEDLKGLENKYSGVITNGIKEACSGVASKYPVEVLECQLRVNRETSQVEADLVIEASKAKNPEDLDKVGFSAPFEDEVEEYAPDAIEETSEINFELVDNAAT